ncbi:tRNA (adenosine(37)-N6)-threonylcarbamoyltransferase complex dimerization subunit type 1 TsaB [Lewinella sp. W8]|uniref:tRNA (adenosine(37)-N6)-threonylcarbamoyltransferase complex dimerization subunit type 1 TsaB n=1 Tax=Lewinella sp. W8 TaxID=2528208 RepID=UPI001067F030|nr:tRNA (adenosine(37)-N6)-threonylcarbamoyltransferase complex dimerization subunit type 1 TsaB [Lewinella sp. W8]MTB51599.1 tRNA (adenosine(37)-N6)-threonylcarbamoyltransferase complex dimerization subunit type 1 TsaB [Lewinella sp. W8]
MNRLLLETATDVCSVAVAQHETVVAQRTAREVHQHASHLTVFIGEALAEAGIKAEELSEVILSDGPGSYTSLRVGAATAKGLCLALPHLELITVPTLFSLAMAAPVAGPVLAVINSRRGEVYGQLFAAEVVESWRTATFPGAGGPVSPDDSPGLRRGPQNIRLTQDGWWEELVDAAGTEAFAVCGPGQERLREYLPDTVHGPAFVEPTHCAAPYLLAPAVHRPLLDQLAEDVSLATRTARKVDVAAYEPYYLNPPFVTKSTKKPLL